jgi:hypothetical protein
VYFLKGVHSLSEKLDQPWSAAEIPVLKLDDVTFFAAREKGEGKKNSNESDSFHDLPLVEELPFIVPIQDATRFRGG